jgi:hypothetical protein
MALPESYPKSTGQASCRQIDSLPQQNTEVPNSMIGRGGVIVSWARSRSVNPILPALTRRGNNVIMLRCPRKLTQGPWVRLIRGRPMEYPNSVDTLAGLE